MRPAAFAIVPLLLGCAVSAAEPDGLIASPEPGWPQWRGPRRDGVSDEKGLLQAWPEGGPKLLWKATGLGKGWSSPVVVPSVSGLAPGAVRAGEAPGPEGLGVTASGASTAPAVAGSGAVFVTGDYGDELRLFALDLNGKVKWQTTNGKSWRGQYPGARAACAYAGGRLYHMNAHGRVACFDAGTGKEIWVVNVLERFGGQNLTWAVSECLLVDGERVIVTPGGNKAFMAALNAKTGETVWASDPLPDPDTQRTGYASPILVRFAGRRMLINLALRAMVTVDADNGKVLWTHPKRTQHDASCATPVFCNDGVFYTLPTGSGAVMLRLIAEGGAVRVQPRWEHELDNCQGGAVFKDGFLYGTGYVARQWFCLDATTGQEKARWNGITKGTLIYADGRLYCLSEAGDVVLAKPHPSAYEVTGRFRLVEDRRSDVWAHPVIWDGRLYLRYHDTLYCYDVRR